MRSIDETPVTPTPDDPADRRAGVESLVGDLGRTFRELRCIGSQRLLRAGISMTHLHVLTMLRHHGPLPMSRLAETLDVSLSNATGLVDRLEERALVERVRVPDDRRVVLVRLGPEADRVLEELELVRSDLWHAILGRLAPDQLDRLEHAVADIRAALEAELASDPAKYPQFHVDQHAHPQDHPSAVAERRADASPAAIAR